MRITCPSCSAELSIQDEFAGRAVKCPKCAAVIPPIQPPSTPPRSDPDESSTSAKPTARPTGRKSRDDDDDDRPARRRSRRDEDDDDDIDDRPRPRRRVRGGPPQKSNTGMILLIVFGVLLLICGGVGYGLYVAVKKVKEKADEIVEKMTNPATPEKFNSINHSMTHSQVDMTLGSGRLATIADLNEAFPPGSVAIQKWTPKVQEGRVMVWKNPNNEDRLFIAFYPDLGANSRVQMKELAGKTSGNSASDGYINEDDNAFAKKNGLGEPMAGPLHVTAAELIRDYTANPTAADRKYKDKAITVTDARLEKWEGDVAVIYSTSGKSGANRIRVEFLPSEKAQFADFKPGNDIEFSGTCTGRSGAIITVKRATIE